MAKTKQSVIDSTVKATIETSIYNAKVVKLGNNQYAVNIYKSVVFSFFIYKERSIMYLHIVNSYPKRVEQIGYVLCQLETRLQNLKEQSHVVHEDE